MSNSTTTKTSDPQDILFLLDESGSMLSMESEPLDALNKFVHDQQALAIQNSTFSLWTFNSTVKKIHDDQPLDSIKEITEYSPNGLTALLDAIGSAVTTKLTKLTTRDVICVVLTDGHENASKEYNRTGIAKLVKQVEEEHNWKFIFLAANQDAFATGEKYGMKVCANFTCRPGGLGNTLRSCSQEVARYRSNASMGLQEQEIRLPSTPVEQADLEQRPVKNGRSGLRPGKTTSALERTSTAFF